MRINVITYKHSKFIAMGHIGAWIKLLYSRIKLISGFYCKMTIPYVKKLTPYIIQRRIFQSQWVR